MNPLPQDEKERLKALHSYNLLDTLPEEKYDALTRLAAFIAKMPIALISLVDKDRQWFKSKVGLDADQTARNISFCQYAIMEDDLFEVEDAVNHKTFKDNPLVQGAPDIRHYAGIPLKNPAGYNLGTLCVIDTKPGKLTPDQVDALETLSQQVISQFELAKMNEGLSLALKENELFFELSLDLLCIANENGKFEKLNSSFERVLGYSKEDLYKTSYFDLIHPEDTESTKNEINKIMQGQDSLGFVNRFKCASGHYKYLQWQATMEPISRKMYAMARDVTQQMEDKFAKEATLTAINQSVIWAEYTLDGKLLECNEKFKKLYEIEQGELSLHRDDFLFAEDIKNQNELWKKLSEGQEVSGEFKRKSLVSNRLIWLRGAFIPIKNKEGKEDKVLQLAYDISQEKKNSRQIENYKWALDQSAIVAITKVTGEITYANDKFLEISKYSREELLGQNHRIINSDYHDKEFFKEMYNSIANGKVWRGEIKNKAKSGQFYWEDTTIVPFLKNGKPYQYMAIRNDITERKKIEEQLINVNKELDQFAYVVSHDLKAPLRAISTLSTFIEEDLGDKVDEESGKNLALMRDRVSRMEYLINDILSYSKIGRQNLKREKVDLEKMINEIISGLDVPENFHIDIKNQMPVLSIQRIFIFQIFLNLISNAIKYNDKKKGILNIGYENKQGQLVFSFKDNGMGIDPKYHKKIFDVFETIEKKDKTESTGIGLSTVKKMIQELNGHIHVKSALKDGTEFILEIPQEYLVPQMSLNE